MSCREVVPSTPILSRIALLIFAFFIYIFERTSGVCTDKMRVNGKKDERDAYDREKEILHCLKYELHV